MAVISVDIVVYYLFVTDFLKCYNVSFGCQILTL